MRWQSKSNRNLIESEIGNNPWIPINYSRLLTDIRIKEASVLIVGANSGYEASLFINDGAKKVVGIDVFTPKIMFTHRKYKFVESAAESLPFLDNEFDIVYSQAVLEHVVDIEKTWSESVRVTRGGGYVAHIASPLWFSRDGHHRPDIFGNFPWCHIGRNIEQWKEWVLGNEFFAHRLEEVIAAVEYCSQRSNINQEAPGAYTKALNVLKGIRIIQNTFDLDQMPVQEIPKEVIERLPIGINVEDLIRFTHLGIVQKS
jgi:SAM-dependent methyltransferase